MESVSACHCSPLEGHNPDHNTFLLFVSDLNSFTLVWLMTGGGPANASQLWITEIYNPRFGQLQYGLASAFSVILFIIMLALGYFM